MRLLAPLAPDVSAPLARAHPLAKLGAAALLMLTLFLTVDPVTPAVVLVVLLAAVPFTGLRGGALLRRMAPLLAAAVGIAAFNAAFAGGAVGLTGERALAGIAVALRLVGIALAGVLAVATSDPTDVADALVQHLGASSRFAVGTLAALRLLPIFAGEWETIGLARRARGLEADRTPGDQARALGERSVGLLVGAIRRATRLALAMDARGFGARPCRTIARPRSLGAHDWALLAGGAVVATAATALSLALGTWRFFLG